MNMYVLTYALSQCTLFTSVTISHIWRRIANENIVCTFYQCWSSLVLTHSLITIFDISQACAVLFVLQDGSKWLCSQ